MSIFPFIEVDETVATSENLPTYYEYAWDFEKDMPLIKNGGPVVIEGDEAIKVWCYKALLTTKYNYLIHSWDYGSELGNLIGKSYSKALTQEEAKRYVREALEINPYIESVIVTNSSFDGDILTLSATITTIYGELEVNASV